MDMDEDNRIIRQIRDAQIEEDFHFLEASRRDHESIDVDVIEVDIEADYEVVGIGAAALEEEILDAHDENEVIDVSDESLAVVPDENELEDSLTSSDFVTEGSYDDSEQDDSSISGEFLTDDEGWDGVDEYLLHAVLDAVVESGVQAALLSIAAGLVAQQEAVADFEQQFPSGYGIEELHAPVDMLELWGDQQIKDERDADIEDEPMDDVQFGGEHFIHGYEFVEQIAEGEPHGDQSPQASDVGSESNHSWLYEIEIDENYEPRAEDVGERATDMHVQDPPRVVDDDEDEDEIDR